MTLKLNCWDDNGALKLNCPVCGTPIRRRFMSALEDAARSHLRKKHDRRDAIQLREEPRD